MDNGDRSEEDPVAETLMDYLNELYRAAGRPSYRTISNNAGISHTHVGALLRGSIRAPALTTVHALVSYLGGDVQRAKRLWTLQSDEAQALRSSGTPDSTQALAQYLDLLHGAAGSPSIRVVAKGADLSISHVSSVLSGKIASPGWDIVRRLVQYFNGDLEHARDLWRHSRSLLSKRNIRNAARDGRDTDETNELLRTISGQLARILDILDPPQEGKS